MKKKILITLALFLSLSSLSYGGTTEERKDSAKVAKNTAKAEKKISMAIGQDVSFPIR